MRVGVYIEHGVGDGVGGAHRPPFTKERVARFSPDDLSRVRFRYVPRQDEPPAHRNLLRRFEAAREWHREVSEGYDIFVNCTHWLPAFCQAPLGLIVVRFPIYVRPEREEAARSWPAWKRLRYRAYTEVEWRRRMATYQHCVANSRFTKQWTERRWGVRCDVVYPPVTSPGIGEKRPLILSDAFSPTSRAASACRDRSPAH
jgi:hypothetical protein